jgi:hypothetical protein
VVVPAITVVTVLVVEMGGTTGDSVHVWQGTVSVTVVLLNEAGGGAMVWGGFVWGGLVVVTGHTVV